MQGSGTLASQIHQSRLLARASGAMGVVQLGCSAASSLATGAAQVQHGLAVGTVGGFHTKARTLTGWSELRAVGGRESSNPTSTKSDSVNLFGQIKGRLGINAR